MREPSTRGRIRAWVRAAIADKPAVKLPELTRDLVARFADDREFVMAWLAETLPAVAYEEVQAVCAATRAHIVFGDEVVSRAEFGEHVRQQRPRWQAWLEHVGDRHVRLWEMRRDDLLAAAAEREARGAEEYRRAVLWRELAARLRGRKTVGEVFTEEEIDVLAASLDVRVEVSVGAIAERREAA